LIFLHVTTSPSFAIYFANIALELSGINIENKLDNDGLGGFNGRRAVPTCFDYDHDLLPRPPATSQ
jgi:hypothetical protein